MKNQRNKLRDLARSRVKVRVTKKTRNAAGFEVWINGERVHQCRRHKEAVNSLAAHLVCIPRTLLSVLPAEGKP